MGSLAVLVGLLSSTALNVIPESPVVWSPDGAWVAYRLHTKPVETLLSPGWLLGLEPERTESASPGRWRLWATRPSTAESVLLSESVGPLSAPEWNRDGTALAYLRLVPDEDDRWRQDVVVQDGPGHDRVIWSRQIRDTGVRLRC